MPPGKKANAPTAKKGRRENLSNTALYHLRGSAQMIVFPGCRPCSVCAIPVNNQNLGGYNGRSALSGFLYCERCADSPPQRLLSFGGLTQ